MTNLKLVHFKKCPACPKMWHPVGVNCIKTWTDVLDLNLKLVEEKRKKKKK